MANKYIKRSEEFKLKQRSERGPLIHCWAVGGNTGQLFPGARTGLRGLGMCLTAAGTWGGSWVSAQVDQGTGQGHSLQLSSG